MQVVLGEIMILLLLTSVMADEPNVVYKEKTEIDFEAVDIEGTTKKPTGALVMENLRATFNPLVNIREEWNKEMTDSLKQIQ